MASPKRDKILRDALLIELNRIDEDDPEKPKRVNGIVRRLVAKAIDGDVPAIKEIFDRVEGKPTQPLGADDSFIEALKGIKVTFGS